MPGPKPGGFQPRPMGGFNRGLGSMNEHLEENAMQMASRQKQLTQQQASTQPGSGKSGTDPLLPQTESGEVRAPGQAVQPPRKPREVGTLKDELVTRPLKDIRQGLAELFDLRILFQVSTEDTPEEQAKKQSLHQRFQKLTQEQQQVAQQKYQAEMQQKKLEQEEAEQKKQEQAAAEEQPLAPPAAPQKGPIGPASGMSRKQKTQSLMAQQRLGLSRAGKKH